MLGLLVSVLLTTQDLSVLTIPIVPPDTKSIWLDALAQCESQGSTTIKVWDTNNAWSVGKYQYQYKTWAKYAKQFGTTKENITDPDLQDKVTRYVLDHGGKLNWVVCSKRVEASLGVYGDTR